MEAASKKIEGREVKRKTVEFFELHYFFEKPRKETIQCVE